MQKMLRQIKVKKNVNKMKKQLLSKNKLLEKAKIK